MGIGKIDLDQAAGIAQDIITHVRPSMARIEVAGSIRRRKPVVGDIELVALPSDRERMVHLLGEMGQFIKPGVPGAIPWDPNPDAKYLRMRLPSGANLDVFIASEHNWGGLYLMRTGGAVGPDGKAFSGFVPGMFSRWKKMSGGGRMTGAQPTTTEGVQIPLREEQDFFELLSMNFVPPEERGDRKAIKKYARVK